MRQSHKLCAANGGLPVGTSQDSRAGLACDPGMLQNLPQGEALPGVPHQQLHGHCTALSCVSSLPPASAATAACTWHCPSPLSLHSSRLEHHLYCPMPLI